MKSFGLEKPEWKAVYFAFPEKEVLATEPFLQHATLWTCKEFLVFKVYDFNLRSGMRITKNCRRKAKESPAIPLMPMCLKKEANNKKKRERYPFFTNFLEFFPQQVFS